MTLITHPGVSIDMWVDMTEDVPMWFDATKVADHATLHFGKVNEYVLTMSRDGLARLVELANQAIAELDAAPATEEG